VSVGERHSHRLIITVRTEKPALILDTTSCLATRRFLYGANDLHFKCVDDCLVRHVEAYSDIADIVGHDEVVELHF